MNHSCVGSCAKAISRRYQGENRNVDSSMCLVMCEMLTTFSAGFPLCTETRMNTDTCKAPRCWGCHDIAQYFYCLLRNMAVDKYCSRTSQLLPEVKPLPEPLQVTAGKRLASTQLDTHHLVSPPLVPHPPLQSKYLRDSL